MHRIIVRGLIGLLAERSHLKLSEQDVRAMVERYHQQSDTFRQDVLDFVWTFVQAGFAFPLGAQGYADIVEHYRLTRRGVTFLGMREDHPLLPGFLETIKTKCPGLPPGVISMLVDTRRCLERHLLRPAIIVLGVAYEVSITDVSKNLASKNLVAANTAELDAGPRIKRIREAIAKPAMELAMPDKDARRAAMLAIDFADQLREQRNLAAHTACEFESRAETEEFIVSAGRHLPPLWSLATC